MKSNSAGVILSGFSVYLCIRSTISCGNNILHLDTCNIYCLRSSCSDVLYPKSIKWLDISECNTDFDYAWIIQLLGVQRCIYCINLCNAMSILLFKYLGYKNNTVCFSLSPAEVYFPVHFWTLQKQGKCSKNVSI